MDPDQISPAPRTEKIAIAAEEASLAATSSHGSNNQDAEKNVGEASQLKRNLKSRHLQMIAIGEQSGHTITTIQQLRQGFSPGAVSNL